MASFFHFETVAASIKALTFGIQGLKVCDLSDMVMSVTSRDLPLLGPSASDGRAFLADWQSQRVSLQGNRVNAYTLNYTYFQASAGQDRGLFTLLPLVAENVKTITDVFQTLSSVSGCKHIALLALPSFGPVHDAVGQPFIGASFALRVTEF